MKFSIFKTLLSFTTCLTLVAPLAFAGPRTVSCDHGDLIQDAIDAGAGSAKPIEINVYGTCYEEDIRITRPRVSINGDGLTTIHGTIRVLNSNAVVIRDLTVTEPDDGLRLVNSRVRLFNVQIVDNESTGIFAADGSVIRTRGVTISGNREGIRLNRSHAGLGDTLVEFNNSAGEFSDGILVLQNSSLETDGGSISGNGNLGIRVNWNSSITIRGTHIESNGAYAVQMYNASGGDLSDAHVVGNTGFGIELGGNSALEMYGGEVRGNGWDGVLVSEHSMLRLHGTTITENGGHGIFVFRDGGVVTQGDTEIFGNGEYFQVMCAGDEASIDVADESTVEPFDCSGF
jgi:hypothetical protein